MILVTVFVGYTVPSKGHKWSEFSWPVVGPLSFSKITQDVLDWCANVGLDVWEVGVK